VTTLAGYHRFPEGLQDFEYRKRMNQKVPHGVWLTIELAKSFSLASRLDPSSAYVRRFVPSYRRNRNLGLNELAPGDVDYILKETVERLDEMFFFGLLTCHVRDFPSSTTRWVPLMDLVIHGSPAVDHSGLFPPYDNNIEIWLRDCDGTTFEFPELLYLLAHEMTHRYLDTFSERQHRRHHERYQEHKGHGRECWELLVFIIDNICSFMQPEAIFQARKRIYRDRETFPLLAK
jgi:hypothetical protein